KDWSEESWAHAPEITHKVRAAKTNHLRTVLDEVLMAVAMNSPKLCTVTRRRRSAPRPPCIQPGTARPRFQSAPARRSTRPSDRAGSESASLGHAVHRS